MSANSQRSFDQVKNILGKLDRNIDAARQRRLQGPTPHPVAAPIPIAVQSAPMRPALTIPMTPVTPMPTFGSTAPVRSIYGRATPMRNHQTGT